MIIRRGRLEIHISNLIFPAIPLLILTGLGSEYLIAFASISLHELGHAAAAHFKGCSLKRIGVTPFGLSITIAEEELSRRESILIFSVGPAVNLLLAAASYCLSMLSTLPEDLLHFISYSNICLAAFNLIPAVPLDGGRILRELLAKRKGYLSAGRSMRMLAFVFSGTFIVAGAYLLTVNRKNFSLLVIGLYMMVLLFAGKMEAALMNIKQIVYRRSKLLKRGVYPARELVAMESAPVNEILKNMDFDCFHFVFVLDEKMKLIGIINENEIMEGLADNNAEITFSELLKRLSKGETVDIPAL